MEKTDRKASFLLGLVLAILLFLAFGAFTLAVVSFDVQPVGFEGAPVGFGSLNSWFHNAFPSDSGFYSLTEYIGYFALALAALNGLGALVDLIRSRGLRGMKKRNIIVCFYYAAVVAFYVGFEFLAINARPISAEASYPSSHTLLALTVLYSQIVMFRFSSRRVGFASRLFSVLLVMLMVIMVIGRLLCGVHWLTDIVGSVLLSCSLMVAFRTFVYRFDPPRATAAPTETFVASQED